METIAKHRHARSSAQKVRLVADLIRGKKVSQALDILTYTNKKAAVLVKKVLESAIANAEHNDGADIDDLKVTKIFVTFRSSMSAPSLCSALAMADSRTFLTSTAAFLLV